MEKAAPARGGFFCCGKYAPADESAFYQATDSVPWAGLLTSRTFFPLPFLEEIIFKKNAVAPNFMILCNVCVYEKKFCRTLAFHTK
ncbi:MAG: hypothetical protein ACKVUS_11055 [Saprospiraceae bacterium]